MSFSCQRKRCLKTWVAAAMLTGLSALAAAPALAADDIGATVKIVNRVTADLTANVRVLAKGDRLRQNEVIEVASDALGELKLNDDTKLALGPGSKMTLDKFVYDPAKAKGTIGINLAKGAFRFVTGVASKNSYDIKTPSASIAVRGTIFDIFVDDDGSTWLLLHEGAIDVCNPQGEACRGLLKTCNVTRVANTGVVGLPSSWGDSTEPRTFSFEKAFPFVDKPPSIDPVPLHIRADIEANTCTSPGDAPVQRRADVYETGPSAEPIQVSEAPSARSQPSYPEPQSQTQPVDTAVPGIGWSGPYIGVTAGGGWSNPDTQVNCDDPTGAFDTVFNTPNCAYPIETGALERDYDLEPTGALGGVTAGFNVAFGALVIGIETDMSKASISDEIEVSKDVPPTSPGTRRLSQDLEWFGTVRGRVGVAAGNMLFYGTGGLAYGRSTYHYDALYPLGDATANVTTTDWKAGWTAGAGAELSFGLWSIKAEYLYYDLGDETQRTQFFIFGNTPAPVYFEPQFETNGSLARVGLNLRLN